MSELSTMACPTWVALQGMAHSLIELDKAVVHVIRLELCYYGGYIILMSKYMECTISRVTLM